MVVKFLRLLAPDDDLRANVRAIDADEEVPRARSAGRPDADLARVLRVADAAHPFVPSPDADERSCASQ